MSLTDRVRAALQPKRKSDPVRLPDDVDMLTLTMVNVAFLGPRGARDWALIDAGMPMTAERIIGHARERYGDVPPRAIYLTHGHFDHVGALHALLKRWPGVPVYAHELELPYLTGRSKYPPADPSVGGGLMSRSSKLYPRGPFDFREHVRAFPEGDVLPGFAEWQIVETPGHSPGHVSFFRDRDRTLIAGDAFVTQKQESLIGVLTASPVLKGPPMYYTPDWSAAWRSVERLAALKPNLAITGHGKPFAGRSLANDLLSLSRTFDRDAIPKRGRYVDAPALTNEHGLVFVPPRKHSTLAAVSLVVGAIALLGAASLWFDRTNPGRGDVPVPRPRARSKPRCWCETT